MYIAANVALVIIGITLLTSSMVIVINAFRQSILWGLLSFFVPFALYVYAIKFWATNNKPFLVHLCMFPVTVVALVMQMSFFTPF